MKSIPLNLERVNQNRRWMKEGDRHKDSPPRDHSILITVAGRPQLLPDIHSASLTALCGRHPTSNTFDLPAPLRTGNEPQNTSDSAGVDTGGMRGKAK